MANLVYSFLSTLSIPQTRKHKIPIKQKLAYRHIIFGCKKHNIVYLQHYFQMKISPTKQNFIIC